MLAPTATVVVVSRDRWSPALSTLGLLLGRTDGRHPVVVVDGRAPGPVATRLDRLASSGRIRVARRSRFLGSNEARNIGADGARTEWIAFVENDSVPSEGWLDSLLDIGERRQAASVYPAYLVHGPHGLIVHGLGADLEVTGPVGARQLREHQLHLGRPWCDVAASLQPVERVQSEPHALAIRREVLERIGGLDEALLSWFEHIDLALHHQQLGAASWFVPQVTCLYLRPPPVAFEDLPSFLLRWGRAWFDRSLDHLCAVWGLDRRGAGWDEHDAFRRSTRNCVPTHSRRLNAVAERAARPLEWGLVRRWDARRARERALPADRPH